MDDDLTGKQKKIKSITMVLCMFVFKSIQHKIYGYNHVQFVDDDSIQKHWWDNDDWNDLHNSLV